MTRDEIIKLAREAGFYVEDCRIESPFKDGVNLIGLFEEFTASVEAKAAAAERRRAPLSVNA